MPEARVSPTTPSAPSCQCHCNSQSFSRWLITGHFSINQRISDEAGKERQIDNIAAQRQQAAISKQQRLNCQDGCHGQKTCIRTQQDGQQQSSAQVSAGTSTGNGKIDHLCCKYESPQHTHQRRFLSLKIRTGFSRGIISQSGSRSPQRSANRRRYQGIRHMHRKRPPFVLRFLYIVV